MREAKRGKRCGANKCSITSVDITASKGVKDARSGDISSCTPRLKNGIEGKASLAIKHPS